MEKEKSTTSPPTKEIQNNNDSNKRKRSPSPKPSATDVTLDTLQLIEQIPPTSSTPCIIHCLYEERKWNVYLYIPSSPSKPIRWIDIGEHYCKILTSKLFFHLGKVGYTTINTINQEKYEIRYQLLKQRIDNISSPTSSPATTTLRPCSSFSK
jgi:hypothetical protein